MLFRSRSNRTVSDLSALQRDGQVSGNPSIVPISLGKSSQGRSAQGITLIDDGMDNSSGAIADTSAMAFRQTESNASGIQQWTLRPSRQDMVLDSKQTVRWVFNGICPDDTTGKAMITISYYDIKGYKDGYCVMNAFKVKPVPYMIAPRPTPAITFKNPSKVISLSWQFFGLDQISILRKRDGKPIAQIENLPAIQMNYPLKFEDPFLWQNQEIAIDLVANDGGKLSYTVANLTYAGPFSADARNIVFRSDWKQLNGSIWRPWRVENFQVTPTAATGKPYYEHTNVTYEVVRKDQPYCRYSLHYNGTNWILSLEIAQPKFINPAYTRYKMAENVSGVLSGTAVESRPQRIEIGRAHV